MKIHLTIDDIAKLVEVKLFDKFNQEVIMPLMDQIDALKAAVAAQGPAVEKEFNEVKAKFEALKNTVAALTTQVTELTDKVASLEGIDLGAEIAAINDSLAKIDAISESDVPVEPAPVV